ncbi:multidrug ABC transporter ATP-binding protein [Thermus scotoductus]|jgi:ABC-2 type transport system ATP-binding protein|uniref:Multidrug ABC transporter ATP-binding protein n=1 Tax=Thermus scotoductus TaxID=37636 RepID=A0A430V460_THESC|nr:MULTISPECIES: ABC transporter ATP-binding protein [Thermus]RTH05242.1 multidrug ABC transporter ATP-binding protein [Thermus scotoductus]RTH26629.1 multidrug ABC transporter ATP-binding protein [Thermus scotoductus]RTI01904.1 multidrug ABC transporter ATP-binding protein [Thermus scotoductus]RTI17906.1 multidrug ABC transporter ATP-binding protein [Thermus scotoductus]RTI19819.1 multidrug ABC transporter ATP-binding protein [Thermus scotoductus]
MALGDSLVSARNLYKRYPKGRNGWIEALRGVSLELYRGEILAVLGPNGSGKTTLIKILAGLLEQDQGVVELKAAHVNKTWVGAVLEGSRNLYWRLSPLENMVYFGVLRGLTAKEARQRGMELLEKIGLEDKAHQILGKLSRGQQQRVALAVALLHDAPVLFLDEPTLGVDLEAQEAIRTWLLQLKRDGKGILLTTHQLDFAESVADRVSILIEGEVVLEGRTQEVLKGSPRAVYRVELALPLQDGLRLEKLRSLGAEVEDRVIRVVGEETLWMVLKVLDPTPLRRVEQESLSLAGLFWQVLKERRNTCSGQG